MSAALPRGFGEAAGLVQPMLRVAVDRLTDEQMRLVAGYQLGWWDADGTPTAGHGGKGLRGALAVLATRAAGCDPAAGVPGAVAVELIHNFSLLHDDVMDRDVERRHRPTGWVAFGEGAAILAGTAMLTLAVQELQAAAPHALPCLLDATQWLISGQSDDLLLERDPAANLETVLRMAAGKTGALMSCSAAIGALAAGAEQATVDALERYGYELGLAFQLVDDILGIAGDPAATGKSASSDLRAGKRSVPIVAALRADNDAARRLRRILDDGPLCSAEDVELAAKLVDEAGGLAWARDAADAHVARATAHLSAVPLDPSAAAELAALGTYVRDRDR